MRLPVPDRFAPKHVLVFCILMFLGQIATGTDLPFACYTAFFIICAATGFNAAGGLLYPSGAFIFFNAVLTAILGLAFKIFLDEPGQNSLLDGDKAMMCYAGGMFAMMSAAMLSAKLRPKRGLLSDLSLGHAMKRAAIGCLFFGVVLTVVTGTSAEGTLGSAFRQINHFITMAILLGATYEFRQSGGRRATNWVVFGAMFSGMAQGFLYFSKEGMFSGPVTWIIAAVSLGYDFSKRQLFVFFALAFFAVYYLVPYSQYVRNFSSDNGSRSENLKTAFHYLGDLGQTRQLYLELQEHHNTEGEPHLFSQPQGFLDRLNMLAFDDALINYTDQGNVFGLSPTYFAYANVLPHFIWRDKPHFAFGNVFGRSIGVIGEGDETTGISFSPTGDAYHEARWFGVLIVWPLVVFLFFFFTDSLTGSARYSPWALLPISFAPHAAPEGMLGGTIFLTTYGIASLLFIVWTASYLMPLLTGIFIRRVGTGPASLPDIKDRSPLTAP